MKGLTQIGGCVALVVAFSGCASMKNWTPAQSAQFEQALLGTANAVDPQEYAGPRQAYYPPAPVPAQPVAINRGRAFTPTFNQPTQVTPPPAAAPIGADLSPRLRCYTDTANNTYCAQ
jgi:hypothetical protein